MERREPSLLPTAVLLGVLAAMLVAASPGARALGMLVSDAESARLTTAVIALVAAVIGGGIAAFSNWIIAKQNRLAALEQEQQKARRERYTARVVPFLEVVDRRLYDYALVVSAVNNADPEQYREAVPRAAKPDIFANSAIMPLAARQNALGVALINFFAAERAATSALAAIIRAQAEWTEITPESLAAAQPLVEGLTQAHGRVSRAIADLYDALDDYLDGPTKR